jgi:nucleoside-diphosphate-sugar epimerase
MLDKRINIFVTGISGFIGRHLLPLFPADIFRLYCLLRPEDVLPPAAGADVVVVRGDLNQPEEYLEALQQCSMVIHMAAELYREELFAKVNIEGVENLISAIKKCRIDKVIHLSSVGVAGRQFSAKTLIVTEDIDCDPKNGYEKSKLRSEELWNEAIEAEKVLILRPTNVFGDGHPRKHLLNLITYIREKRRFYYSSRAMVNYVYVGDVAGSIRFFATNPQYSGVYQCGTPLSLKAFAELIKAQTGSSVRLQRIPAWIIKTTAALKPLIPLSLRSRILSLGNAVQFSGEKLQQLYPFSYGYSKGLERTIDYYKSQSGRHD